MVCGDDQPEVEAIGELLFLKLEHTFTLGEEYT